MKRFRSLKPKRSESAQELRAFYQSHWHCSWCGAEAAERHYTPEGEYVASFCSAHSEDSNATPDDRSASESVEKRGEVSGPPTESGEFGASSATVGGEMRPEYDFTPGLPNPFAGD